MNQRDFEALKEGDIVRSASGYSYVVTDSYGDWKVAVRTVTVTNPQEWTLVTRSDTGRPSE